MVVMKTSPGSTPIRSAVSAPLLSSPRWRSRAPFGKPVVPDVYWIMTGSSGLTAGSVMLSSSPAAMNEFQSSKQMISRNSGQFGATACIVSSIGLPRKPLTTKTPAERDCFSTYSTSLARKAGFTVTSTMPAIPAPNSSIIHSGRFCAQTAMRSPGLKRDNSARAVRWASR